MRLNQTFEALLKELSERVDPADRQKIDDCLEDVRLDQSLSVYSSHAIVTDTL